MMPSILHQPTVLQGDTPGLDYFVNRFAEVERARYGLAIEPGADGQAVLREILREIDETILPRRVSVECQPGGVLTLIVSNRRLLAIEPRVEAQQPAQETPEQVARLFASVLRSSVVGSKTVSFMKPEHLGAYKESGLSVSAALLRDALGLSSLSASDTKPSECALSAVLATASSWIEAKPDMSFPKEDGPEEEVNTLKEFWRVYAGKTAGLSSKKSIKTRSEQCFFIPLQDEIGVFLITEDKDSWVLALAPKSCFRSLHEAGTSLQRRT